MAQDVPFGSFAPTPFEPDPPVDTVKWLRSMQPGFAQEVARRLRGMPESGQKAARFVAPGLYDYATEPAPTYEQRLNAAGGSGGGPNAQLVPNAAGKVPDVENTQRPGHALADVFNLATTVLPTGAPAKAAIMAAPFAFGRRGAGLLETAAPKGIRAYHGSPHDFERFDISKIGTGEGAQSYGHGLYFAENEGVARSYRDALGRGNLNVGAAPTGTTGYKNIDIELFNRFGGDLEKMIAAHPNPSPQLKAAFDDIVARGGVKYDPAGRMYEVNINARPEQFLDWDKPLSGQIPQVQEGVKGAMGIDYHGKFDPQKANRLWNEFQHAGADSTVRRGFIASDDKLVANRLREAGVPGIKYLDQGSRRIDDPALIAQITEMRRDVEKMAASGKFSASAIEGANARIAEAERVLNTKQTSNYVLFDDKLIDILRKYAIPGMLAPPAAAAVTSQPFGSFAPQ